MNSVSLIVLVLGLFLMMVGYFQYTTTLIKNKKIEYRYIPRRLLDEQFDATSMGKISEVFKPMFNDTCSSVWGSLQSDDCLKQTKQTENLVFKNVLLVE